MTGTPLVPETEPLQQNDFLAELGQSAGGGTAHDAAADDDVIDPLHGGSVWDGSAGWRLYIFAAF